MIISYEAFAQLVMNGIETRACQGSRKHRAGKVGQLGFDSLQGWPDQMNCRIIGGLERRNVALEQLQILDEVIKLLTATVDVANEQDGILRKVLFTKLKR